MTPEELNTFERTKYLPAMARENDNPAGYAAFYKGIFGNVIPKHCADWIDLIYNSKAKDRGVLIWAFRGSWKTTTISIGFLAFRIGHEPERANLLFQASDDSARKTARQVADIIENNPFWKMAFPNVVPDPGRGWGAEGYEVKRNDIEYTEWRSLNAARKDPTLIGLGYGSRGAIGKHPDGVLMIDDIHDEQNTVSEKERQKVIKIVTDTIMPMVVEDQERAEGNRLITWELFVGTPWQEEDVYHYIKNTGEFEYSETPVMKLSDNEEGIDFSHMDLVGNYELVWPERFSESVIKSWRNKSGKRGFARMYLLDLEAAKETGLKYFTYPHEQIDPTWPFNGGVDYASIMESMLGKDISNRSYFAMAYGAKAPIGGVVCYDGIVEHCTQLQAEGHVEKAQGLFPNWNASAVESDGVGNQFIALIGRKPHVRIIPMQTKGRGKKSRLEIEMGPWLESGLMKISDADTKFLNMLRKSLDDYPNGNLDVLDALYWLCRATPEIFQVPTPVDEMPSYKKRERKPNPFLAFGSK